MTDDVLAKLDRYLNNDKMMGDMIVGSGLGPALATEIRRQAEMVQRARDEIVALRSARNECERQFQEQVAEVSRLLCQLEAVKGIAGNERKLSEAIIRQARDEALEEAARVADGYCTDRTDDVAAAIRALKEKH